MTDTGTGEALPLLAFTLERLAVGVTRGQELSLQRYLDLGGVERALTLQADAALQDACRQPGVTRDRVMSALLSLVTIDEQDRPTRRRVEFADSVRGVLEPFVARRLLSTTADGALVSVAHEAFLVHWKPLKDEIDVQQTALQARRVVENDAAYWTAGGQAPGLLLEGDKLTKATIDTGAKLTVHHAMGWAALEHSVYRPPVHRLVTRVELNDTARDFLEESIRGHRSKSRKERIIAIVVIVWVGTQLAQRALRGEETLEFIPIAIVVLAAVFVVWAVFFSVESVQGNRARK